MIWNNLITVWFIFLQRDLPFLCTPFLTEVIVNDIGKAIFNQKLCSARVVVENTIGILKERFPVLKTGLCFKDRELWSELILGTFYMKKLFFSLFKLGSISKLFVKSIFFIRELFISDSENWPKIANIDMLNLNVASSKIISCKRKKLLHDHKKNPKPTSMWGFAQYNIERREWIISTWGLRWSWSMPASSKWRCQWCWWWELRHRKFSMH